MKKLIATSILLVCIAFSMLAQGTDNYFYYNGSADVRFRFLPRGSGDRAIVHGNGNILCLNFEDDFTGGTLIGNCARFRKSGETYQFELEGKARLKGADVFGLLRAKEIKVETMGADFVFEKDYQLPTLEEVATHIKEKKHLPDVPSAKEMQENGISLGEMNAKLLQKIEELTLYIIAQEERIQKLENK